MCYRIRSTDGRDVLCTYKADPDDTRPTVGFLGAEAVELLDGSDVVPMSFRSFGAALRCATIYGGEVESPGIPENVQPVIRTSINGGW